MLPLNEKKFSIISIANYNHDKKTTATISVVFFSEIGDFARDFSFALSDKAEGRREIVEEDLEQKNERENG